MIEGASFPPPIDDGMESDGKISGEIHEFEGTHTLQYYQPDDVVGRGLACESVVGTELPIADNHDDNQAKAGLFLQ